MTNTPSSRTGRSANRKTKRYLAGAALVSGGLVVGALFSPVGIAGAQSDSDPGTESVEEAPATEGTESTDGEDTKRGRHGRRGHRLGHVTEISGLTTDQLREGFEAGQTLAETAAANGV
ncbi:MAG: hypothetical protein AAFN30_19315, partial [Actinomycetota bacterium]